MMPNALLYTIYNGNMGEQKVSLLTDKEELNLFVRDLLKDMNSLEYMLENDWFESGITCIGAEQEMCLVDLDTCKPAPLAMEALEKMTEWEWVETELAKFNLEITLTPRILESNALSAMEDEIWDRLTKIQSVLKGMNTSLILTGILPTLRKFDMGMHNLTPKKRYKALMEAINAQLIGPAYELKLNGIDELQIKHDSPLLEACNTSFQVHLQVSPNDFVKMYNISQVLTAPIMALAANSSLVFGRRLWHESRIALFQQSLDTRSSHEHLRERSPRVNFGKDWLKDSILEIYREDIARFRVLISADQKEDSEEMIKNGQVPKLRSLQVHNSTVYRWNRPCYGISASGKPHLRIENRVLASGPSVVDEVANAALWIGAMLGMEEEYDDITKYISFADARDNFIKAARYGIDTNFTWLHDEKISAVDLNLKYIIPLAEKGLRKHGVDEADIDKYMNVIRNRLQEHQTGARWLLRSYTKLKEEVGEDEALSVLTYSTIKNQENNTSIVDWGIPDAKDLPHYRPESMKVEGMMNTDLFTVQEGDIIDIVAEMMLWKRVAYMPVEDSKGNLKGLITSRNIMRHYSKTSKLDEQPPKTISEIMIKDPITTMPESNIIDALKLMQENRIGCLPVVQDGELIGIITEEDFVKLSSRLLERLER